MDGVLHTFSLHPKSSHITFSSGQTDLWSANSRRFTIAASQLRGQGTGKCSHVVAWDFRENELFLPTPPLYVSYHIQPTQRTAFLCYSENKKHSYSDIQVGGPLVSFFAPLTLLLLYIKHYVWIYHVLIKWCKSAFYRLLWALRFSMVLMSFSQHLYAAIAHNRVFRANGGVVRLFEVN